MASNLKWLLGAAVVGGGIVLLTRPSSAMTPTSREPTEAEDIADWRQKMGLPPEGAQPQSPAAAAVRQRIILCFGDSLSTGDPPYWKYISTPIDTLVDGKGWGGQQVAVVLKNSKPIVAKVKPTDVVLLAGVNNIASGKTPAKIIADLQAAWDYYHAQGARVIAVELTPWFGYEKYFGKGKKTAQPFRDATNEVNSYIGERHGKKGGPEVVVRTSSLGDSYGALKKEYSAGGLHLSAAGRRALAALVAKAL